MHNITKNKHKTKQIRKNNLKSKSANHFQKKNLANITPKFKTNKNDKCFDYGEKNDKCFNKKALMIMGRKMN